MQTKNYLPALAAVAALMTLPLAPLWSQCTPIPLICNVNQCGYDNVNLSISVVGNNVVCDGATAAIAVDETLSLDFDEFDIYWCDGLVETFTFANQPVTHTYNIPDSSLCDASQNSYFVHVVGRKQCANGQTCRTAATSLTVNYRPLADFSVADLCLYSPVRFINESCNEEEYFWTFGDGSSSTERNPEHTYSASGVYTVSLIVTNQCGSDEFSRNIRIVENPEADFAIDPQFSCQPDTISFTNLSNQWSNTYWVVENDSTSWSFADSNYTLSSYHLALYLQQYEAYILTLYAFNACGRDSLIDTVHIYPFPAVDINAPLASCDSAVISPSSLNFDYEGEISGFEWEFENGTPTSASGPDFGEVVFHQSGSVRLRAFSPCDTLVRVIPITVATSEAVAFVGNPAVLCQSDAPLTLAAIPSGGGWIGQGAAAGLIDADGRLDPADFMPDIYTFIYTTPGTTDCPSSSAETTLQIIPAISAVIAPVDTACEQFNYTPQVVYAGDIDAYSWAFPGGEPISSNLANPADIHYSEPGTYQAMLTMEGACGTVMDSVQIFIQENLSVSIIAPQGLICTSSLPFELQANHQDGIWSGAGITDSVAGLFSPYIAQSGLASIVYTLGNGACTAVGEITLDITAAEALVFPPDTFCIDSEPRLLSVSPTQGTFSGTGVDTATGLFKPAEAALDNNLISYVFMDTSGCIINGTTLVLVEALPQLSLPDTILICLANHTSSLPSLTGYTALPEGGTSSWSGPGIIEAAGSFNPDSAELVIGTYMVYVEYQRYDCSIRDSLLVQLAPLPQLELSPDTSVCISDGTLQLNAEPEDGSWTGPDIDSGLINLTLPGGNQVHTYHYVYGAGTSCEQAAVVQVEIIDLGILVDAGPDVEYCEGQAAPILGGAAPAGQGYWQGCCLTDSIAGLIDTSLLMLDTLYRFDYCLENSAASGCRACDSRTFIIHSNPEADFSLDGTACVGETFNIQNQSSGANEYFWDFGDNMSSTLPAPSHQYQTADDYSILLTATATATGCRDTARFDILATTPPMPAFTLDEDEGCAPFPLLIQDNSSGFDIDLIWYINGGTFPGLPPTGILLDSITEETVFIVRLMASNLCGDRFAEAPVTVRPYPIVQFGIFPDEGCSPLTVELANTTLGNPQSFHWDFGNGQPSSTDPLPPPPIYTTTDSMVSAYTISLLATNECGADSLTKQIVVYPPDVRAFIEADTLTGCQPLAVNLQSYSTPGSAITWVAIDEQGNQQGGGNQPSFQAIFDTPGWHTVLLYASRCGTDVDTAYIQVLPAPTPSFVHSPLVCAHQPLTFFNTSQNISASSWDFGDGSNGSDAHSPVHVFDEPGTYTVTLTANSIINDCPAIYSSLVEVIAPPQAAFVPSSTNGCSPLSISLTNQSSGGSTLNYIWDFGDGGSVSFLPEPTHVYMQPGNYVITLTVYDVDSCFSSSSVANIFVFPDPVAYFELAEQIYCLGHSRLQPNNLSENAIAYEWRWQNLQDDSPQPLITPQEAGVFPLQLVVWNTFQCRDTFARDVEIRPSPIAQFTPSLTEGCQPLPVQFSNTSASADAYIWDFSDGNGSATFSPGHIFEQAGSFSVSLIAQASNGCPSDTLQQIVQVWPKPLADFAYDKPDTCGTPIAVSFINRSEGHSQSDWRFGDGGSSSLTNPTHLFQAPGLHQVELMVSSNRLCRDTAVLPIDIFGQPRAALIALPREGCEPLEVVLLNESTQASAFKWLVEPLAQTSTAHAPTLLFEAPGTYDLQLIAIYNDQCQDTLFLPGHIQVYESPTASFTYQANLQENILGDVEFTNASLKSNRYFWDLGDGSTTTEEHPYHEYSVNRDIEVLLVAYNDNSGAYTCADSLRQAIEPEWITTFFAPNALAPEYGEGGATVFQPVGIGIKEYAIAVYSPWGQQVWHSTALIGSQPAESWNGSKHNHGPLLPQGAYSWRADIVFVNGIRKIYTGSVTLLR